MAPIRLLLVDDETRFVENLARILRSRGFVVDTAESGEAALRRLMAGGEIDVAVVDLCMPGMDGIETLRAIKGLDAGMEVIMLTGHGSLETGVEAIREGAFDYLMKPCDPPELVEKINEAAAVEAIRACPMLWPRTRVDEILFHPFRPLAPDQRLADALAMFVSGWGKAPPEQLFVVDGQDRLRGALTRRDLVREAGRAHPDLEVGWEALVANPDWLPDRSIQEILVPKTVMVADCGTGLAQAAQRMFRHQCRSLPVVDGENFLGVIRLRDVLQYLPMGDTSLEKEAGL